MFVKNNYIKILTILYMGDIIVSDNKVLENAKYILKDIIQGDNKPLDREEFDSLSIKEIKEGINLLINNPNISNTLKKELIDNSWKVLYHTKPPKCEDFITEKWLGETATTTYPYIKDIFIDFMNPNNTKRHLILSPFIGFGKSYLSSLINIFIATHFWCMRKPFKFFYKLSPATIFAILLISFTEDKAKELYLEPIFSILESSNKFRRCKTIESMKNYQRDNPGVIHWTTAGNFALQFSRGVKFRIGSDPGKLIGLTIVSGAISELSFWVDFGIKEDVTWRIYQDLRTRVWSRMKNSYYGRTIIDSSPNSLETRIDKYIFNEADNDKKNYVVRGAVWDYKKWEFDLNSGTFPIFTGSNTRPPKIIEENEISLYNDKELIFPPKLAFDGSSVKELFERDLIKNLKDIAGIPAGNNEKLFTNIKDIDNIFKDNLKNIYTYIYAPADKEPKRLIYNQIRDIFFIQLQDNNYFYRAEKELRYIGVDQSESGNMTAITMLHPEMDYNGNLVIVIDFTIPIVPTKSKINLDAICEFMVELKTLGKINIAGVYFDQYQSASTIQRLNRIGIEAKKTSVDSDINAYLTLVSWILNEKIKCGKNIVLKNNLKSLVEATLSSGKKKIDHTNGQEIMEGSDDWHTSIIGQNAKDASDSLCNAFFNCINEYKGIPRYQWKEEITNNKDILKNLVGRVNKDYLLRIKQV